MSKAEFLTPFEPTFGMLINADLDRFGLGAILMDGGAEHPHDVTDPERLIVELEFGVAENMLLEWREGRMLPLEGWPGDNVAGKAVDALTKYAFKGAHKRIYDRKVEGVGLITSQVVRDRYGMVGVVMAPLAAYDPDLSHFSPFACVSWDAAKSKWQCRIVPPRSKVIAEEYDIINMGKKSSQGKSKHGDVNWFNKIAAFGSEEPIAGAIDAYARKQFARYPFLDGYAGLHVRNLKKAAEIVRSNWGSESRLIHLRTLQDETLGSLYGPMQVAVSNFEKLPPEFGSLIPTDEAIVLESAQAYVADMLPILWGVNIPATENTH